MKLFFSDSLSFFHFESGKVQVNFLEGIVFKKIEGNWVLQRLDKEKSFDKYVEINGSYCPAYKLNCGSYLYDGVGSDSWLGNELLNIRPSSIVAVIDYFVLFFNRDQVSLLAADSLLHVLFMCDFGAGNSMKHMFMKHRYID